MRWEHSYRLKKVVGNFKRKRKSFHKQDQFDNTMREEKTVISKALKRVA